MLVIFLTVIGRIHPPSIPFFSPSYPIAANNGTLFSNGGSRRRLAGDSVSRSRNKRSKQ